MASAAIRLVKGSAGEKKGDMPIFGCPRHFTPPTPGTDPHYVRERFEETDLRPIFAVAATSHTVQQAFAVIFEAHIPQDTSLTSSTRKAIDCSGHRSPFRLIEDDIPLLEFCRGCGVDMNWLLDPALLQNAKLELDGQDVLASSKVIGAFGSIIHPNIVFQQGTNVGVYSCLTKDFSVLSQNNDFFEAGIEFSTFENPRNLMITEPHSRPVTPPSAKIHGIDSETLSTYLNLPASISLFPIAEATLEIPPTPAPKTPKQNPPYSPSFFSPSFASHSASSNHYDPRTHTVNFPLHLTTPTRSKSYPSTPSPSHVMKPSTFSLKSGSQIPSRSGRRKSHSPGPNISAISPRELEILRESRTLLVIDIRAFAAYAKSRFVDAINVCIPTVLLKRSSLSLDDISESIVARGDRGRFAKWKEVDGIMIYDADSLSVKDSYPVTTLAAKFIEAGFNGATYGLIGSPHLRDES